MPVLRNRAGNTCCCPRNKDPEAINSPKHIRQRWRAIRCTPKRPPRTSMRTSLAAESRATEPRKKNIPLTISHTAKRTGQRHRQAHFRSKSQQSAQAHTCDLQHSADHSERRERARDEPEAVEAE